MRQTKLYTKTRKEAPSDETSKNAQLLIRAGFIHKEMAGVYSLLPLGLRVLTNIKRVITEEMEKLGSDFFPRGVRFRSVEGVLNHDEYNAPQITKTELIKLWEMSGDKLHRGTAERILSERSKQIVIDIGAIEDWGIKIKNLLEQHIISSTDNKFHLLVALASEDSGGKCGIWLAESPLTPNIS